MPSSWRALVGVAVFALVAASPALHAQATTGTIYGTGHRPVQGGLPGVTVQVRTSKRRDARARHRTKAATTAR